MKTTLTLLLLAVAYLTFGQQYNDFEISQNMDIIIDTSLPDNIWTIGTPDKVLFNSAFSQPNAIFTDTSTYYPNNNYSTFQFTVDQHGFWMFPYFILEFRHKIDMEFQKDGGWVEASYDNGATWHNVFSDTVYSPMAFVPPSGLMPDTLDNGEVAFTGTQNAFYPFSICWGDGIGNPPIPDLDSLHIRFVFQSDSVSSNHEGWILDDFSVTGTVVDGIAERPDLDGSMNLFPNPATETTTIKFDQSEKGRIDIFDSNSKLVKSINCNSDRLTIDTRELKSGLYFVLFEGLDDSRKLKHLIIND